MESGAFLSDEVALETYFGFISAELRLYIALKLDYDKYLETKEELIPLGDYKPEFLVKMKNVIIWEKIDHVLKRNTELKFKRYTYKDAYIWNIIFIDLMSGFKIFIPYELGRMEGYDSKKYNSVSIDLLSLYVILSRYPNIYKYVGNYFRFLHGPFLFLKAVITSLLVLNEFETNRDRFRILYGNDPIEFLEKVKIFAESGNIDQFVISHESLNVPDPEHKLKLFIMVHILLSSLPKSVVSITPDFTGKMSRFLDFVLDGDDKYVYSEYFTHTSFYDDITHEIENF